MVQRDEWTDGMLTVVGNVFDGNIQRLAELTLHNVSMLCSRNQI